jgi:hypothetical protein
VTSRFARFAAIDWSGAKGARHKGIAVAICGIGQDAPELVEAPGGIWSRQAVADWLIATAREALTRRPRTGPLSGPMSMRSATIPIWVLPACWKPPIAAISISARPMA